MYALNASVSQAQLVSNLFSFINSAKNLGDYGLANSIFSLLLEYRAFWNLELKYETSNLFSTTDDDDYCDYYDLLVITNKENYACIPLPLLTRKNYYKELVVNKRMAVIAKKNHFRALPVLAEREKQRQLAVLWQKIRQICPRIEAIKAKHIVSEE